MFSAIFNWLTRSVEKKLDLLLQHTRHIMQELEDLKAAVAKFVADVEAYKTNVKALIDAAIVDHDAGLKVDLVALKAQIDAEDAAVVAPAA